MKKTILLTLFVLSLLFVTACEIDTSKVDLSKVDTDQIIKCEAPYIRVGAECCVDQDDNKICDKDEIELEKLRDETEAEEDKPKETPEDEPEKTCSNECSADSCDGLNYVKCEAQTDGCKDKINKGKVIGKCDVECLKSSDCPSGHECPFFKCEKIITCTDECLSERCDGINYIACEKQTDGCKDEINKGKVKGKCGVECLKSSDCNAGEICVSNTCEIEEIDTTVDLSNYPNFFRDVHGDDANKFDGIIVTYDLNDQSYIHIINGLTNDGLEYNVGVKTPDQISDPTTVNLVTIGNPCENSATYKLMGEPYDCDVNFKAGKGMIMIVENGDNVAIVVAGKEAADTLSVAKILANHDSYGLDGMEAYTDTSTKTIITSSEYYGWGEGEAEAEAEAEGE